MSFVLLLLPLAVQCMNKDPNGLKATATDFTPHEMAKLNSLGADTDLKATPPRLHPRPTTM